jgi:hypothetical protein
VLTDGPFHGGSEASERSDDPDRHVLVEQVNAFLERRSVTASSSMTRCVAARPDCIDGHGTSPYSGETARMGAGPGDATRLCRITLLGVLMKRHALVSLLAFLMAAGMVAFPRARAADEATIAGAALP